MINWQKIHNLSNWFLDCLFPKYCLGCSKEDSYICNDCFDTIPVLQHTNCFLCDKRSPSGFICEKCKIKIHPKLNGLLAASSWNSPLLRQMIYQYKYNFIKELSEPLTQLIIRYLENINFFNNNASTNDSILVPVPLHKRRLVWRGFNQAQLLAQKVGDHFQIPVSNIILKRSRSTLPQVEIKNKNQRRKNIQGAFKIVYEQSKVYDSVKNKTVILVDDVCTTSATLEECAKVLQPLKPQAILGLVIARG